MNNHFPPSQITATAKAVLRQLADSAPMLIWMAGIDNVCTYLNQGAAALIDKIEEIDISAWIEFVHPDDVERIGSIFNKAQETRTEYQVEYRIIKSDGSIRWMMGSGAPRFTDKGEFSGYIGVMIDVSDRHAALEQLAKSEAGHRLLTENSSDMISHHSADDGVYLYASPSFRRVLGYEPKELSGISVYDQIHPDDVKVVRDEILKQVTAGPDSDLIEFRIRHKNGQYIWIGSKAQVLFNPVTKEKIGSVAVSRDITSERIAREELKKREERFRSLTNLSSDWYWETDENGRFVFMSERVEQLFGRPPSYHIGMTRNDLATDPNQPALVEYFAKVAKREPFKNLCYSVRGPVPGKARYANISGEPIVENGAFKGYRGIGRDVTEDIQLAERLAQLAAENNALIENSLDIMILFDDEGRILRANHAVNEILGYAPEELIGRGYVDFIAPEDFEKTSNIVAASFASKGKIQDFENRWIHKNGSVVYLSWSGRWSEDARLNYATARDVTEQYHIRAELQKSRDRLTSTVESIGDAFFTLDRDWHITYLNQKTAAFVRRKQVDLIGKILWEAVPEILFSSGFPHYRKAMETGQNAFFESYWEPVSAWVEVRIYAHEEGLSVFFHDVTARREAESAIRDGEQRLRKVIEMTPAGYVLTDASGRVVDVNPALCHIAGYTEEELIGLNAREIVHNSTLDGALLAKGGITVAHGKEATIRRKDGQLRYVLGNVNIERDVEGNALSLTAFLTDITERKESEARMEQLATHDALTGLPNRALINIRLQQMLNAARHDESISVMFIDLDRFKQVNDSMGHAIGDILLQEVARRLQGVMRANDIIARLGGDEFIAAAYCAKGLESAAAIAEKLLSVLGAPFNIEGQEVFVSASIGISMFPRDGKTNDLLFQNADTAMYRAKEAGRNGYCIFEAEMSRQAKTRMTIEHSLRRALERNEFELHYQPRIDLQTMAVTGMEAIIRWNHPQLGRVPPLQFIPIAEERGLIEAIGQWVLEEACEQTRRLIDKFGKPLQLSVNLSARQLKRQDLLEQVERALKRARLPYHLLELELTESALVEDMDISSDILKRLKQLGIMLSVDDFGTGYSGLSYLQRFPLDTLKLDRSFLNRQTDGSSGFEFIKAFVDMAHALNLSVVAEGVENMEIVQLLRESACDAAQGYLFAEPLSLSAFEEYLAGLPSTKAAAGLVKQA